MKERTSSCRSIFSDAVYVYVCACVETVEARMSSQRKTCVLSVTLPEMQDR